MGQKWPKTSETQSLPFGHFIKSLREGRKFGPNGIETDVHNFFFGALQRKPRASPLSSESLPMGNMLQVLQNGTKMGENERDAKSTLRPFYKEFERGP